MANIIQNVYSNGLNDEMKKERIGLYSRPENTPYSRSPGSIAKRTCADHRTQK